MYREKLGKKSADEIDTRSVMIENGVFEESLSKEQELYMESVNKKVIFFECRIKRMYMWINFYVFSLLRSYLSHSTSNNIILIE